jgi:eukaryotic-like serine/threonine-protein kinase
MGTVYLAHRADDQYQKRVAIKLVSSGMDSSSILRRFRNERQILASLDQPNIAKLLDGGTTEAGMPYFVMDYIEGIPIDQYCDDNRLSTAARLRLFRTVCLAVHYAHQNLVVHRDIKPSNILITADGTPKLLDFGIAKVMNPELAAAVIEQTMTGYVPMTPAYASPEQVRGASVTTLTDVYSLGVVLYQLLTGHAPYHFKSSDPAEIARIICEREPPKPSTVVRQVVTLPSGDGPTVITITPEVVSKTREGQPDKLYRKLSGDLDNIVLTAIRKEPQKRYASVEQFSEDIRRHLEGLPVIARKGTFNYRAAKFVRRNRVAVAAATLVVLSLLAGIIATLWQARIARAQRAEAELRFNDVRRLANSFLFEFDSSIEKLPGSTPAREMVVKRALEYLDSLAQKSASDASLQRELAAAYEKVADIQGNPYSANLGDTAGALVNYRKALAIRDALAADPADKQARRELAQSCNKVGDELELMGDLNGALDYYRRSLEILELLSKEDSTNNQLRRDLAGSYDSIGDTLAKTGDAKAALDDLRKALAIRDALAASDPGNNDSRRALAISYNKVASALVASGDSIEALGNSQKALAIFVTLAAANPNDARARRELSVSYSRTGDVFWASGDKNKALENYREALKIREELSAADPTNAQAKRDLAIAYGNLGSTLAEVEDSSGASDALHKSLVIFESLSAKDPSNAVARLDLAFCCTTLAEASATLGSQEKLTAGVREQRWREARAWYQRGLDVYVELRNRGALRPSDSDQPEKIAAEIAKCDAALSNLHHSIPRSQ